MNIKSLFWKIFYKIISGNRIVIGSNFCRRKNVDIHISDNGRIKIGDNVFFNKYCTVASKEKIEIGDNSIFGEAVKVYDSNHRFSDSTVAIGEQGYNKSSVYIGSDCWIGSDCVILKGVKIGNHSIIGAGCIIDFDVPDWTIIKRNNNNYEIIERRH